MTNVIVVAGAQFGSEAKGATVAHLSRNFGEQDVVIRVAGPNAGHTAYDPDGREWKLRAVPVAAATNRNCHLHIAAGSEVDLGVLFDELAALDEAGHRASERLTIHPSATILMPKHIAQEATDGLIGRVGSTGKGIGAARADRIMRSADTAADLHSLDHFMSESGPFDLSDIGTAIIEGTQGYGLGLHTSFYPKTTSSDCRAIDFLAMAGIMPWSPDVFRMQIKLVARCFPIRVAGNSGPLQGETTWPALGLPEERTTVTNKVRRVGRWDDELLDEAIRANGGGQWSPDINLVVTMLDQLFPEVAGVTSKDKLSEPALEWLAEVQDRHEIDISLVGTSPTTMCEVAI